jgi:hypothetical protein
MRVVSYLLDKIAVPIAVTVLTPAAVLAVSKLKTGDWLAWTTRFPPALPYWFGILMALWFGAVAIRHRIRELQGSGIRAWTIRNPIYGWVDVGCVEYAGVKWRIRAARDSLMRLDPADVQPEDLDVQTPPRCPKCETEIEQVARFWGGYYWGCVRCGFRRKNRDSYFREMERVEKLARREWEMELAKRGGRA